MVRGDTIEFKNDIIMEITHESTELFYPIFIVKRPDGGTRLILNLKELN